MPPKESRSSDGGVQHLDIKVSLNAVVRLENGRFFGVQPRPTMPYGRSQDVVIVAWKATIAGSIPVSFPSGMPIPNSSAPFSQQLQECTNVFISRRRKLTTVFSK